MLTGCLLGTAFNRAAMLDNVPRRVERLPRARAVGATLSRKVVSFFHSTASGLCLGACACTTGNFTELLREAAVEARGGGVGDGGEAWGGFGCEDWRGV